MAERDTTGSSRWSTAGGLRGDDYDRRWSQMAAAGESIHGEADLVSSYEPSRVLDAGCGTGRVAIELHRRGVETVGVDSDPQMLAAARRKAPELEWRLADLSEVDLAGPEGPGRFDVVVLAGNVMIFLDPGTEARVVENMARHLAPGGRLVAGFQIQPGGLSLAAYDTHCAAAGLELEHRWATWHREPLPEQDSGRVDYAVSVHRSAH